MSGNHGETHFVGIAGSGMSSLAGLLLELGETVSGCDLKSNAWTVMLEGRGARIYLGHSSDHLDGVRRVVMTRRSSVSIEVQQALALGIPVVNRSQLLGSMMDARRGIAVAGTHGKTTTTSLLATLLIGGGLDPTVVVGGVPVGWELGGRHGAGEWFLAEADEFDRSFLYLHPEIAVLTGIDMDHPDTFTDIDDVQRTFGEFLDGMPQGGTVVADAGDARGMEVARRKAGERGLDLETYGDADGAAWRPVLLGREEGQVHFEIHHPTGVITDLATQLAGRQNLDNATGAVAAAIVAGVPVERIRPALSMFHGVGRRFERKGEARGVVVVDDYAHHPAAIEVIVEAARGAFPSREIWVAFQPHWYNRTRELMHEFAASLRHPDQAYVLDVYATIEAPLPGATGERMAELSGAVYAGGVEDAAERILADLKPGVLLLTLGSGSVTALGPLVLAGLEGRGRQ